MARTLTDIAFVSLLPDSISRDETVAAAAAALDGVMRDTGAAIGRLALWSRVDEIDEPLLSLLAWQLHVDFWDPAWTLAQKRRAVRQALAWHRRKGTPVAVVEGVELVVGGESEIIEWFDYGGAPYRFKVTTTESLDATGKVLDAVIGAVQASKNTRSWLDGIIVRRAVAGPWRVGGVTRVEGKIMIAARVKREFSGRLSCGGVMRTAVRLTV